MNRETLEARLKEIEKGMEQTIANYNLLMGGKQEVLFWLKKLEELNSPLEHAP